MELRISDLLDALTEAEVDIRPNTSASESRIKELTMKKIHSENKKKHRSLSAFTKVLLAAAIMASLAIPVMAATGFQFTDWLEGLFNPGTDYHSDLTLGSASKSWEVSGWVVNLAAEDVSAEGMTVVCEHHTNQAQPQTGTLAAEEGFWLEKWNGSGYDKLPEPQKAVPAGKTVPIQADATARWAVDWSGSYGALEAGSYRLGKNFIYTATDGKQETVINYVKFRVFTQDMAPIIADCKAKMEALRTKESYHLIETVYPGEREYDHYVQNYWKHGEDYLVERRYIMEDGSLKQRDGYLYRDGKGYKLTWTGDNVLTPLDSWESADWLDESNRDMWTISLEIFDSNVGQVIVDENTTRLVTGIAFEDGRESYNELTFTQNPQGELIAAQKGEIPGMEYTQEQVKVYVTVEVQDTAESEIAKTIAAQAVGKPVSFSWQEEQGKYPAGTAGVKTEGFANTTPKTIADASAAIAAAKAECTLEWQNTAAVAYDETANMWRVELGFSQDREHPQIVYLTSDGVTKLVVTK